MTYVYDINTFHSCFRKTRAMGELSILPLPYRIDCCDHFARLRSLPGAVLLDSARAHGAQGRFDVLSALPLCELVNRGNLTTIRARDHVTYSTLDPFLLVAQALEEHLPPAASRPDAWPFQGGAIGWFGYDLGRRSAGLALRSTADAPADMQVGIYGWALLQDHEQRSAVVLFTPATDEATRRHVLAALESPLSPPAAPFLLDGPFRSNFGADGYERAFARVQRYLLDGDCYQVNLAQRLSAPCHGDPWAAYLHLRARTASPFSAFLQGDDATAVLSFSPERFVRVTGAHVETRPIKGTIRRGSTPETDRIQARALLASEKDRAENVMIVDLMRNDLARSCRIGSVRVEKLCTLESYANVHHLVSVISGTLDAHSGPLDVLARCFPGGSITGAPKIRAMQIIDELEPDPRSVYCGAIGYVSRHGAMDTSIAIRTLVCDGREVHAWGGGGIVVESDCSTEYRETLTKIEPLLDGLRAASATPGIRCP